MDVEQTSLSRLVKPAQKLNLFNRSRVSQERERQRERERETEIDYKSVVYKSESTKVCKSESTSLQLSFSQILQQTEIERERKKCAHRYYNNMREQCHYNGVVAVPSDDRPKTTIQTPIFKQTRQTPLSSNNLESEGQKNLYTESLSQDASRQPSQTILRACASTYRTSTHLFAWEVSMKSRPFETFWYYSTTFIVGLRLFRENQSKFLLY